MFIKFIHQIASLDTCFYSKINRCVSKQDMLKVSILVTLFLVGILGETMTSEIHSESNRPLETLW